MKKILCLKDLSATSKDSQKEDLDNDEQEDNSCPWETINNQYVWIWTGEDMKFYFPLSAGHYRQGLPEWALK